MVQLTDEKKAGLFRMLAEKSLYEAGVQFGFDKYYSNASSIRQAASKIYNEVKNNPEHFGLTQQTVDLVSDLVKSRMGRKPELKPKIAEAREMEKVEMKDLVLSGRRKAFNLLHDKMDRIASSRKRLDEVSITALAQTFGIIFDKAQIIQGEATENIAVHAQVDKNMSPEDALDLVLKIREVNTADKSREKTK